MASPAAWKESSLLSLLLISMCQGSIGEGSTYLDFCEAGAKQGFLCQVFGLFVRATETLLHQAMLPACLPLDGE